jgi:HSP20 family protein
MEDFNMVLPVNAYDWLDSAMNRIFNDQFSSAWKSPAMNVMDEERKYLVELAVPGLSKEDLDVRIDQEENLIIKMANKMPDADENTVQEKKVHNFGEHYLRRDFAPINFERKFLLPSDVDKDHITARIDNGILTLSLPKKVEESSQRQIEVA